MRKPVRTSILAALVLILLSFGALPVAADTPTNIELTVRVGQMDSGKEMDISTYTFTLVSGESRSYFDSGLRMPIPTTVGEPGQTTYSYQNIGFSLTAKALLLDHKQIEVDLTLEDSSIARPGKVPVIATVNASANTLLTVGKPLQLTTIGGTGNNSTFIEIEANILK
jgi:hypothetical protein